MNAEEILRPRAKENFSPENPTESLLLGHALEEEGEGGGGGGRGGEGGPSSYGCQAFQYIPAPTQSRAVAPSLWTFVYHRAGVCCRCLKRVVQQHTHSSLLPPHVTIKHKAHSARPQQKSKGSRPHSLQRCM